MCVCSDVVICDVVESAQRLAFFPYRNALTRRSMDATSATVKPSASVANAMPLGRRVANSSFHDVESKGVPGFFASFITSA